MLILYQKLRSTVSQLFIDIELAAHGLIGTLRGVIPKDARNDKGDRFQCKRSVASLVKLAIGVQAPDYHAMEVNLVRPAQ